MTSHLDQVTLQPSQRPQASDLRAKLRRSSGQRVELPEGPDGDPSNAGSSRRSEEGTPRPGRTARKNAHKRAQLEQLMEATKKKDDQIERLLKEVEGLKRELQKGKGKKTKAQDEVLVDDNSLALLEQELGETGRFTLLDSHFHLDRINRRNKKKFLPGDVTSQGSSQLLHDSAEMNVGGGVMIFCDPADFPNREEIGRLKRSPLFGIALGIHPSYSTGDIDRFIPVVQEIGLKLSEGIIEGIGEIGFDAKGGPLEKQEKLVSLFLPLLRPEIPLILHIRGGGSDRNNEAAYGRALAFLLGNELDHNQVIQLHCFSGSREVVRRWSQNFPNCFFSFSGLSKSFSKEQIEALRSVPDNRILVETDSPYLPVQSGVGCNFPGRLGEVVQLVARLKGVDKRRVAFASYQNMRIFFRDMTVQGEVTPAFSPA